MTFWFIKSRRRYIWEAQAKRALIGSVTNASLVWAKVALMSAKNRAAMDRAQRTTALQTTHGYRTTSADVSSVLLRMLPADILTHKRARIHDRKTEDIKPVLNDIRKEERTISVASWQARRNRSTKGRWTHRLLLNLSRWLNSTSPELSFHLTQTLTGHRCYQQYLYKMNRADDSGCVHCGRAVDDVEYTTFHCPQWNAARVRMWPFLNVLLPRPKDVIDFLCGPPGAEDQKFGIRETFQRARVAFISMIEDILSTKEEAERDRQRIG